MRPAELVVEGEITEIFGRASSGRTSVLVACLGEVTRRGGFAALVDAEHAFDPVGAARAGVELGRLLWVRCGHRLDHALRAVDLLVRCPGLALVALDAGALTPRLSLAAAWRLRLAVRRSGSALVIAARSRVAGSSAALALEATRRALEWTGPASVPTRLESMATALHVVRARSTVRDLHPGAVHLAWWNA